MSIKQNIITKLEKTKVMKKIFLSIVGLGLIGVTASDIASAKNPYEISNAEIVELLNNINNELSIKDIPALEDKVVVVDENWNVIMEQPLKEVVQKSSASDERLLIKKSEFLMEYAGDRYYLLEK